MKKALLILFCCTMMISCSSFREIRITDSVKIPLLPSEEICEPFDSYQLMEGSLYGFKDAFLETYTVADGKRIEINMLTSTGQTIGKAIYEGRKATIDSAFFGKSNLAASYIFFDFQLCHASAEALSDLLESRGLSFNEVKDNSKTIRTVCTDGQLIYEIYITEDKTVVNNYLRGYYYYLETI